MCSEKFFGIKIDNKLTLEEHVEGLCKKACQKVSAVARIESLMRFEQRFIVDLFITSHFFYYLVWMFHSSIDHIHERAIKVIYQDYNCFLLKNYSEKTASQEKYFNQMPKAKVDLHFERSY